MGKDPMHLYYLLSWKQSKQKYMHFELRWISINLPFLRQHQKFFGQSLTLERNLQYD